ncbi:MAG: hypothetical protein TEF_04235 [Rhizobiales bacterium NRL2]|jgi:predicted dithiol-disulfide oxidoreductase (DUF899 family)|nr:MAG: hypothetical protein TEF_04235 [Rhizobiales bacterium NRL2]
MTEPDNAHAAARAKLLEAEMALRDQREAVARMRRALPEGPAVEDYVFEEAASGAVREVRLSELFGAHDTLIVIHFMYGRAQTRPCPMCSMWADTYDRAQPHVAQRAAMVLAAAAPAAELAALADARGWTNLRMLSSERTGFNRDFGMENPEGDQEPGISVFTRGADGSIRQHYTAGAVMAEGEYRGLDLLSPVWNLLDLTPEGRGDWMPGGI